MNKFLILIAVFLLTISASYAQTEKGSQTLGVDAGFSHAKTNNFFVSPADQSSSTQITKMNSFNIGPNYSYFIADKLDLGASLNYGSSSTNYSGETNGNLSEQTSNAFSGTLYLRKYFLYENKIGLRAGPYVSYTHSTGKTEYLEDTEYNYSSTGNEFFATARLDFVYFPSKNIGLTATVANLYYDHIKTDNGAQGNNSQSQFGLNLINTGVNFSIFYVFGGKG